VQAIWDICELRCRAAGKRVGVIINYDRFRINQDMYDAYAEMDRYFLANYFSQITRYATSAFLRAKLGEAFSARSIAPHVFERREEAQAFLAGRSGDASLVVLLIGLATPGQARDAEPGPWEMLGDVLRKGKPVPIGEARPRAAVSKVESADLWDAFLTQVIKRSAGKASEGDRRNEFLFVLLSGRHDGVALLASDAAIPDPLRELFLLSWERLAPLLRGLSGELDAQAARQFEALLKAGDALQAAQGFGDVLGVRVTPDTLRQLVRLGHAGAGR
jgi:hypothetical protein